MSLHRLCLVLNATYEPVNVCTARRALTLVHKGAALVERASKVAIHTAALTIPLPDVIRLVRYRRVPRRTRALSRKEILIRDRFTCQYCGTRFPAGDLTLDHVLPKSRAGENVWENLVAACFPCNNRKRNRTPEEAGMKLARAPLPISIHAKHRLLAGDEAAWKEFLFC